MVRTLVFILCATGLTACASSPPDAEAAAINGTTATVAEVADLSIRVQMLELDKAKLETKLAQLEGVANR